MADHTFMFVLLVVFLRMDAMSCKPAIEEPVCTSRYGFESSLLKDMLKLDFDMSILKQRYNEDIETLKTETKLAMEKMDKVTRELERTQADKVNDMTTLGNDLKQEVDGKINEIEATKRLLEGDFADMYKNLELKSDTKLDEIRAEAVKPPVAFLVKTLSDQTAGKGKILKFTESVFNTNGVYDHASGYFTAPVNGTYVFSVQLCPHKSKNVHIQMFADDIIISNVLLFGSETEHTCSTVNAIAILSEGSRVCAKLGNEYSSGTILFQYSGNRWAMFMGTLAN